MYLTSLADAVQVPNRDRAQTLVPSQLRSFNPDVMVSNPSPSQPVSPPRSCVSVSLSCSSAGPQRSPPHARTKDIVRHLMERIIDQRLCDPALNEQVVESLSLSRATHTPRGRWIQWAIARK